MHTRIEINFVMHIEVFVYKFSLRHVNIVHICTYWGLLRGAWLHE